MKFKIAHPENLEPALYSIEEFEKKMGIVYLPQIQFQTEHIAECVSKKCSRILRQKRFAIQQKWLGTLYAKELEVGFKPRTIIRWISAQIGYGVFADQEIAPFSFIGSYTGVVRRRHKRSDSQNDYCFDYRLGEWFSSRFLIDAERYGNESRFINHSDTPNLEPLSVFWRGTLHIVLRSTKPLSKGEELTYDYGSDYWTSQRRKKIS